MSFNEIIIWIMAFGAVIGGVDKILGNKLGLGEKFEEGFKAMGPLAIAMVGIVCLAPVISDVLGPIITPVATSAGIDPAILGSILSSDMGGYPLAMELATNKEAGLFFGLIVAAMLGATISFSIPVGLSMIEKEDQIHFAKGLLIGITTIPVGALIGGFVAGFNTKMVLVNSIPVIIISVLLILGLKFIQNIMVKGCIIFGKFMVVLITVGLIAAAFESLTGVVTIPGMAPIDEAMKIVGEIGVVLLGTFPTLAILTKILNKPLEYLGKKMGINSQATAGIIFTLANSVPVYSMMKKMNVRGKIVNTAWLVPATAALGDLLGFTASVNESAITAMIVGKLSAGAIAVIIALVMTKNKIYD